MYTLEREQHVDKPLDEVFAFFSEAQNLGAITPPFMRFRILTPLPIAMKKGTRIDYSIALFGLPMRWRTHITAWEPGERFIDEQESGPYALWRHTHWFEARGDKTLVRDLVEYEVPFGPLGTVAHALFIRRTLDRIFDYRHDATERLLEGRASA